MCVCVCVCVQANDLAHKLVLQDLVPMVAIHGRPKDEEVEHFQHR